MVAEQTKQILSECGIPQRVISDTGIQFTGEAYQQFVCTWKIEHVTKSVFALLMLYRCVIFHTMCSGKSLQLLCILSFGMLCWSAISM